MHRMCLVTLVVLIAVNIVSSFRWHPRPRYLSVASQQIHSEFSVISSCKRGHFLHDSPLVRSARNSDEGDEDEEGDDEEAEEVSESTESAQIVSSTGDGEISLLKQSPKWPTELNGSDVRVGIIMARWNGDIIQSLYKGVNESLVACGVKPSNTFVTYVPGAYEIPITARFLAASKRVDVIVCLGCLIKGDTMHFEYIAGAAANGIMQVALESYVPCIFGVLTVLNKDQAIARCTGPHNEGLGWGISAVEMGLARMSALGMDKQSTQSKKTDTTSFVTFTNGTLPVPAKDGDAPAKKKIGF